MATGNTGTRRAALPLVLALTIATGACAAWSAPPRAHGVGTASLGTAPLAVRFPRGGPGMVIAMSLMIFGIYYMSLIGGESLGDKGSIKPFWGPWAPNLIFFVLSIFGLARMGRERGTTRGGSWNDALVSIGGALVPRRRKRAA